MPGLTFVEPIGRGGFADVYLYQQRFPARRVAVKVLRETADGPGVQQFRAEANVMAQLSGHPSIVPIFQADISPDGRAYLVMEYCPPPHLAQRFRSEQISVPEVLNIGIKVASAVETAHRVGILHRDIKPHNILTSTYGAPLLTDFGIASVAGDPGDLDAMSIPWSPPEAFGERVVLDVRSDVYSLAATVYSLLAGRSPLEVPGGANDGPSLIDRIERVGPARLTRPDVPDSLNALLARALAKRLADRPRSAMAFARGLQEVQIGLRLPLTRLEVLDASPEGIRGASGPTDARTEIKPISIIVPDGAGERGTLMRPHLITGAEADAVTEPRPLHPGDVPAGGLHPPAPPTAPPAPRHGAHVPGPTGSTGTSETAAPARRSGGAILVALLLLLVAAAVGVAVLVGDEEADPGPETTASPTEDAVVVGGPPAPVDLTAQRRDEQWLFRWKNPDPEEGDVFLVRAGPGLQELEEVARGPRDQVLLPVTGDQLCVWVAVVRDAAVSTPVSDCVARR